MRHVPSSPAGTPAGGKTGYFAGPGNRKECACTFFPISRAGKIAVQPITDRLQGQPRLKLTVLKHVSTKTRI